jgi:ribonuclease H / adenosylcobalamin/alpha-ribazole phosphatase
MKQFRYVGAVLLSTVLLGTGSATASAEESIVIDFVRHGQSVANAEGLIDTSVPGTPLTQLGQKQANDIADVLAREGHFAGIFASQLIRTQQTAAPLAARQGMDVRILRGLNEIDAGAFNGLPQFSPQGLLYLLGPVAWVLGLPLVPMLAPGSTDVNGVVFDLRFTDALQKMYRNALTNAKSFTDELQTMYANALTNPVRSADGKITEVAFSSEFAIEVGTLMNVKNPDPLLMLLDPLPNTGIVVIEGNPQDGWTLVSWNGKPVPPGRGAAWASRDKKGLCLMLNVPTEIAPCVAKPPLTASAPQGVTSPENLISAPLRAAPYG